MFHSFLNLSHMGPAPVGYMKTHFTSAFISYFRLIFEKPIPEILKKLVLLLGVIIKMCAANALAQPYYFRHYEVEQGLANNTVECSLQDRRGFMWFGTRDGLNRFDGYSFKTFQKEPNNPESLGNNFVHSLYEDINGTLWVGTEHGLFIYDATKESFKIFNKNITTEIRDIQADKKGNLWFIGGQDLFKYHLKTHRLHVYQLQRYFEASSICVTADGTVWISTVAGTIEKYLPGNDSFVSFDVFKHSPAPGSLWIEKIFDTGKGSLLIGTSRQGVKLFDLKTLTYKDILTYNDDHTEIFARDFIHYAGDEYWIATESGIFIYNLQTGNFLNLQKKYNNTLSISDNAVYTLCKDKEGGLWAGTYFGGVNYYSKQYILFEKFFPQEGENSISGNAVREICADSFENLWIGTEDGGLNKLQTKTGKFVHFKPNGHSTGISNINIHGLLASGDTLWIGTFEHGLDLMDIKTGKVIKHYAAGPLTGELKNNFIYSIYKTRSNEILLATGIGLYRYQGGKYPFQLINEIPEYIFYTHILEDSEGTIWLASYRDGLYYYNPKTRQRGNFFSRTQNTSAGALRINRIFEDSNKIIWIASEDGLYKFNAIKKTFKKYSKQNGFPSNLIFGILEDAQKNLWISTSRGLVCFNPKDEKIKVYTKANGLLSDQFNYNSAYKDSCGRMYFGSLKGLIRFDPADFIENHYVPPVYITGFQVYNKDLEINQTGSPLKKSLTLTDTIILKYNQSSFSIDFAALSFTSPEMTEYSYKMAGLDKDWTYLTTNRKVYFTELKPGKYVFMLKASVDGSWNNNITSLVIQILPPFWASPLAYLIYTITVCGIIYYSIRNYHKRLKTKNRRKLELLEHEKEKEVYQAKIDFFTNVAHEIRTPLTLIKGPMEKIIKKADEVPSIKNNLKIMERNTDRLLTLTGQLLDFRKTEAKGFSLNFVKVDITALIKDNYVRFKPAAEQKKVRFKLELTESHFYAYADLEALNKIMSNLINNAIKYAEKSVYIQLTPDTGDGKTFSIKVKNDGYLIPYEMKEKIFDTFFRIKETEKQSGSGIGLALARSLAELHKGSLNLSMPENNMNIFTLTLPVRQDREWQIGTGERLVK